MPQNIQTLQSSESVKESVHKTVEMMEATANIARSSYENAKASLTPEQLAKYEHLSLSVCFALLEASELDSMIP